jgi:hypothetical protein
VGGATLENATALANFFISPYSGHKVDSRIHEISKLHSGMKPHPPQTSASVDLPPSTTISLAGFATRENHRIARPIVNNSRTAPSPQPTRRAAIDVIQCKQLLEWGRNAAAYT